MLAKLCPPFEGLEAASHAHGASSSSNAACVSWRAIRASRVALRRAACPWWCSHHAALSSSRRRPLYRRTLAFQASSCSSGSGRRSCDARLQISRSSSASTLSARATFTKLPSASLSLAFVHLVRLWPKEHPPSCRPILPVFLMLARVVAAPRFHQLVEAAIPLFSAAFVGLPSLPPLPPRAIALFAAVRHATLTTPSKSNKPKPLKRLRTTPPSPGPPSLHPHASR